MPGHTSSLNSPNNHPVLPTSPDPVVVATDACISLLRTANLPADTVPAVRNAVAKDYRYLHTRVTDVFSVVSDRLEIDVKLIIPLKGSESEDIFRELRLLENEDPDKEFMIFTHTNEEVDRMNHRKFDNFSKVMVLKALDVPLTRLGSGFALRTKRREDVKVVVGGKVMITHNLKMVGLANGMMARLVRVIRENEDSFKSLLVLAATNAEVDALND